MFKTLYGKIVFVLSGLFLFIGLMYILLTVFTTRLYVQEGAQRLNHNLAQYLVSKMTFIKDGKINQKAIKESFDMLMNINQNIELYLINTEGEILGYSAPPGRVKRKSISMKPVKHFLGKTAKLPILGDDPRNPDLQKVFSSSPILNNGNLDGYLYIILGSEEYDNIAQMLQKNYLLRLSTGVVIAGLIFVFVAGLLLFRYLTRRLRKLTDAMESFKQSDFIKPMLNPGSIYIKNGDEIDRMETVFYEMSLRIFAQINKIKQSDIQRRELISHVSHDLRTPLTSLQGYLETLQIKGEKVIPHELLKYLETGLRHSKRLEKLISELFDLAKLDSHDAEIHLEPFHIGELAQDIVQNFQLQAEKKQINLLTKIPENISFVLADIGLIERAIQNLLDNALRCTNKGGEITLVILNKDDFIKIEVKDNGCGISHQDIPFLFDRFYHTDKKEGGTGLGLAITKRIVELHGSKINLQSKLNFGTTFSFCLPIFKPAIGN